MTLKSMLRSTLLAMALASLAVMPLAAAGVEGAVGKGDREDCAYARAAPVPAGWMHDAEAEEKLRLLVVLVRNGQSFLANDGHILVTVSRLPVTRSIEDFIAADQNGFRLHYPGLRIVPEPDVARASGRGVFKVFLYEKPSVPAQRYDRIATTLATDAAGTRCVVDISLSAPSMSALEAADASFREILNAY
jgi:hypothetical protein